LVLVVVATLVETVATGEVAMVERASEVEAWTIEEETAVETTLETGDEAAEEATEEAAEVDATTVEAALLVATVVGATAEEEAMAAQISWVTWRVVAASAEEQLVRTQDSAPLVMACWFAVSHWQAVSVAEQVVSSEIAVRMQG